MNAVTKIKPDRVFNALAAYEREREYSKKLERALSDSLGLLTMECGRRELRGEDVAAVRQFIAEQRAAF